MQDGSLHTVTQELRRLPSWGPIALWSSCSGRKAEGGPGGGGPSLRNLPWKRHRPATTLGCGEGGRLGTVAWGPLWCHQDLTLGASLVVQRLSCYAAKCRGPEFDPLMGS